MRNKIVVPENIKQAALDAAGQTLLGTPWQEIALASVEAAMRCLSENPIVPTTGDVLGLLQERVLSGNLSEEEYCGIPATTIKCVMREWQRRMFLAPEPVFDATLGGALLGRTFTREQANAMKHIIDTAVHG
jgi:hypothetical protein